MKTKEIDVLDMYFGVYIHKKTGKLALMAKPEEYNEGSHWDFVFDEGKRRRHPFLNLLIK